MNDRYLLLAAAYADRDRYMLILFVAAALIVLTDWATRTRPWLNTAFRIFLIIAFLGVALYAWAHPVSMP